MARPPEQHPFRRFLAREGKTQQWAADRAADLGRSLSQSHLSELMAGNEAPSMEMLALLEQISVGKVKIEEMARWHVRHLGKAA